MSAIAEVRLGDIEDAFAEFELLPSYACRWAAKVLAHYSVVTCKIRRLACIRR